MITDWIPAEQVGLTRSVACSSRSSCNATEDTFWLQKLTFRKRLHDIYKLMKKVSAIIADTNSELHWMVSGAGDARENISENDIVTADNSPLSLVIGNMESEMERLINLANQYRTIAEDI